MQKHTISTTAVQSLPYTVPLADQLVLEWKPKQFVLLQPLCLRKMMRYTTGAERETEAGGIFLGNYRGPHIEITNITEPLPKDVRAKHRFDRKDPGHQLAAKSAWEISMQTTTYTGEWHTHPEHVPTPSSIDLSTWKGLVSKSKAPLTFIILGWSHNWYGIGFEGQIFTAKPV